MGGYMIVNFFREVFAIFLLFWGINPESKFYSGIIYAVVLGFWLMFSLFANSSIFFKTIRNKGFVYSWFFPLFIIIGRIFGYSNLDPSYILIPFIYYMFWYYWYLNNTRFMRILVNLGIIYILVISLNSIYRLSIDRGISRFLAQGDQSITSVYASPFLADFKFIYSITMVCLVAFGLFYLKNKQVYLKGDRIKLIAIIVILFFLLLMAQYTISIILTTIFIILLNFALSKKNYKTVLMTNIYLLILIFVFLNLPNILHSLAEFSGSVVISNRLIDIANFFSGGIDSTIFLSTRVDLYLKSIWTFLSNPIIGIGRTSYLMNGLVGGHSAIFDNLAYYGIFGFGLLALSLYINYTLIASKLQANFRIIYRLTFWLYVIQNIFNPGYYMSMLYVLYLIIPFYLYLNSYE
jgi:hypothetical protein